jgi:hypothetical protein
MKRRRITITTVLRYGVWQGQLDLPGNDQEALEQVWRLFNRVETEDVERLEEWGYRLPSLSVGDRVTLDGKDYWVNDLGWVESKEELSDFVQCLLELQSGQ